jgi:phosphatidylserine decarboxylase
MFFNLLRYVPKNYLSLFCGGVAAIPVPRPLRRLVLGRLAQAFGIDISEAAKPIEAYGSFSQLFCRSLRSGIRPIAQGVTCPVDGTLRETGRIDAGTFLSIKGTVYQLAELLGGDDWSEQLRGGYFWNLYLAPHNYHRVHAPVSGRIDGYRHIPGALWPVNDWSLNTVDRLFAVNERVVVPIIDGAMTTLVIFVGATNVGSIKLAFAPAFQSNRPWVKRQIKSHTAGCTIAAGDELGMFELGSTVIVLTNAPVTPQEPGGALCRPVHFGEQLAALQVPSALGKS